MVDTPEQIRRKKQRARRKFRAIVSAGGGTGGVRAFAFQSETDTLVNHANFGVAPSANRKRAIDRAIKRLKTDSLWGDITWLNPIGANADASITNWVDPTQKATIVGAPTFTANVGYVGVANTGYINIGLTMDQLVPDKNNFSAFVWSQTTTTSSNADCGATNAGSVGFSIACRRTTDNNLGVRMAGAFDQVSPAADSDGFGLNGASRTSSSSVTGHRNGVQKTTVVRASDTFLAGNVFYLTNNGNGAPSTTSGRQLAFLCVTNRAWNETETRKFTAIMGEYLHTVQFGDYYIEDLGIGTEEITVDCAAVGFTLMSIMYCEQAQREGKTVALLGGHRDRYNIGGVVTGGLGFTDFNNIASLGGLSRYAIRRCNLIESVADTTFKVRPKTMLGVCKELLDDTKNGGYSIPLYISNGVKSVVKTGTEIQSLKTMDGRTVTASQFFDGTYEGDLLRLAGVGYTIGREAAGGSGLDVNNGVKLSTTDLVFDPWFTENTPASGLIPHIHGVRSTFTPSLDTVGPDGTADSHVQSYNFRVTATNIVTRRVPFPTTPPINHVSTDYEFLHRYLDQNPTIDTFEELFKEDVLYVNTYDVNNEGFVSIDFVGNADDYALASYPEREVIWKRTWNYILGFFYECQYGTDGRIPAALKTSMAGWGFLQDHYYAPHERDEIFQNPQMYIRESLRMVSDAVLLGNDLDEVDASAIRISNNTVSTISYNTDSHACQRVAYEGSAGVWTTRNEGGLGLATGGVDQTTPLPFEICVPKASECTNLAVGFCLSTNHIAFGACRMEPTMWQVGQSFGLAAAMSIDGDNIIQNVNQANLRTNLLASAELAGEVAPVLPQVN